MASCDQTNLGRAVTFLQLIEARNSVRIPIIQRDYAQGRESARGVMRGFIDALHRALTQDVSALPLDLDFIYGDEQKDVFSPLDGQQRLTLLFLLHWYLAWRGGKLDDFRQRLCKDGKSKFSYEVRPSSGDFFDALLAWQAEAPTANGQCLSAAIRDQSWYFLSWQDDPTVQSCLTVLDAVHEKFKNSPDGLYDRLTQNDQPCITFQLLSLKDFGLSEDLYIKMNARGKPLTPFESFKAQLEDWIGEQEEKQVVFDVKQHGQPEGGGLSVRVSVKDYMSQRFDTAWSDLLWLYRGEGANLLDALDEKIMYLFHTLATNNLAEGGKDGPQKTGSHVETFLRKRDSFSLTDLREDGGLDKRLVEAMAAVMDAWCGGSDGIRRQLPPDTKVYDERGAFEKIIGNKEITYEDRLLFHGYCTFIRGEKASARAETFPEWMRVVRNLVVNQQIDNPEDFVHAVQSITALFEGAFAERGEVGALLGYLATPPATVKFFSKQQVREERLKAQLMLRSSQWRTLILEAEDHGYFCGQIEFLLKFSGVLDRWIRDQMETKWAEGEDDALRQAFSKYLSLALAIFDKDGLKKCISAKGDYVWERALLSVGDYLLKTGSNHSFLDNKARDASWKRLLRGQMDAKDESFDSRRDYVKTLLDQIDPGDVKKSLNGVIDKALTNASKIEPWRREIIRHPQAVSYCQDWKVRWRSKTRVYLLTKTRMSSRHAELFTFCLHDDLLAQKEQHGWGGIFDEPEYEEVTTDQSEPDMRIKCTSPRIEIRITNAKDTPEDAKEPLFSAEISADERLIRRIAENLGSATVAGDRPIPLRVPQSEIHSILEKIARLSVVNDAG